MLDLISRFVLYMVVPIFLYDNKLVAASFRVVSYKLCDKEQILKKLHCCMLLP